MIKNNQAAVPINSFLGNLMANKYMLVKEPARLPIIEVIPDNNPIELEKAQCFGMPKV